MTRNEKLSLIACLFANTAFGFSFLFSKLALDAASSAFVMLSIRFLIAVSLLSLLWIFRVFSVHLKGKRVGYLVLLGLLEPVVYFVFETYGIANSSSSFAGVMIALIPLATMLLAGIFLSERPTLRQTMFMLLSIGGVLLLSLGAGDGGTVTPLGTLLLAGAVFAGSAFGLLSRKISGEFSSFERTYVMMVMGAVFFTALAFAENGADLPARIAETLSRPAFVGSILFLSVCCSCGAFLLINFAFSHISAARTTSFANLTTAVSVLAGIVILKESFAPIQLVAMACIVLGVFGVNQRWKSGDWVIRPSDSAQAQGEEEPAEEPTDG